MIFTFAVNGWCAAPALPKDEQVKLTAEVRAIFEAKCLDCHGSELPRPKGKFGYVLDLKRVAANPKYVVPGHPEKSDLYDLVFHDDMPGEDANVPALTKDEREGAMLDRDRRAGRVAAGSGEGNIRGGSGRKAAAAGATFVETHAEMDREISSGIHALPRRANDGRGSRGGDRLVDAA